jgi:hypothetical protein
MMSIDEKKQLLGKAFWDREIDPDLLYAFVNGEIDSIPLMFSKSIYLRLLSTYDWYTLLSLLPMETLEKATHAHGQITGDPGNPLNRTDPAGTQGRQIHNSQ